MKIRDISITNFKGLDSINFGAKTINVIVGRNNTGKTSILESIALAFIPDFIERNYSQRPSAIINYLSNSAQMKFEVSNGVKKTIEIHIEKSTPHEILRSLIDESVNISNDLKSRKYISETRSLPIKGIKVISRTIESLSNEALQNLFEKSLEMISNETISAAAEESITVSMNGSVRSYKGLKYYQIIRKFIQDFESLLYAEVLNMDKKASPDIPLDLFLSTIYGRSRYQEKGNTSSRQTIYVKDPLVGLSNLKLNYENDQKLALEIETILKNEKIIPNLLRFNYDSLVFKTSDGNKEVPMGMMGDGFKVLVSILGILKSVRRGSIVLIEEPEVHLHPGYIEELVRYLINLSKSTNIQLFISTHSYDLIEYILQSENFSKEEKTFLNSELQIVRLSKGEDSVASEEISYSDSVDSLNNLLFDLRGI